MKIFYKSIVIVLSAVLSICLCSCGEKVNNSSENLAVSKPVISETLADDTLDPENLEQESESGGNVSAHNLGTQEGKANGIDVSKWQGKIDWQKTEKDGIDFAIVRIGYRAENGKIYRDTNADYNIQQAIKNEVLVGVYFFSTANSVEEATAEAKWVAEQIRGYKISYPVVYDCEGYKNPESRMYELTCEQRTEIALAFLNRISELGYEGMFYGAKSDLEDTSSWNTAKIEAKYKIWIAHYTTPTYPQTQNPDYSGRYDMWQYTDCGSVAGINGNCDMIVSYFIKDEANAVDDSVKPETAKPPKSEEELLYEDVNDSVTAKQEVNLREGPSTKYNIVGVLKSGSFLKRTGIGKNGWSRLEYNGQIVYAITSYLSNEVIEIQQEDIVNGMKFTPISDRVTAKVEVNLRILPTTNSSSVGQLKAGDFLNRIAISENGWSRLEFNGQQVYAVTNYLTNTVSEDNTEQSETVTEYGMEFKPTSVNVTAKEEVNLRDKPSTTDSNVIYTLKNGDYVQKVGESSSGWSRIIYNGQMVYAITSFLTQ